MFWDDRSVCFGTIDRFVLGVGPRGLLRLTHPTSER